MMLVRSDWLIFGHGFPMQPGDDERAFRWRGRLIILVAAVVAVFILTAKLLLGQEPAGGPWNRNAFCRIAS